MKRYDQVEVAVSRIFRIKPSQVIGWHVHSKAHMRGIIDNRMILKLQVDPSTMQRLINEQYNQKAPSVRLVVANEPRNAMEFMYDPVIEVEAVMLYGKETQRVFEALARVMTYQKPKRMRGKK